MKKLGAIPIVFAVCLSSLAFADEKKLEKSGKPMEAVIVRVDTAAKTMKVRDAAGQETTICWSDSTKIEGGTMKEGETVHVRATEKDGKTWASWIHVGRMTKM
jgi:hypothetical protein